jgi:hypothetical protein
MINTNDFVSDETKIEIVTNRLSQFASEAYQYQLNLKTAEAIGASEQIESIKKSLIALESAIKVHQEELKLIQNK